VCTRPALTLAFEPFDVDAHAHVEVVHLDVVLHVLDQVVAGDPVAVAARQLVAGQV